MLGRLEPMPKIIRRLTTKEINAAKPGEIKQDGRGLMLVVDGKGNKRWVLRYTRPDGRRNMTGLGSNDFTPATLARIKAADIREKLARGVDPVVDKKSTIQKKRTALRGTFKIVAEEWYCPAPNCMSILNFVALR
jgi:hypothetical protein